MSSRGPEISEIVCSFRSNSHRTSCAVFSVISKSWAFFLISSLLFLSFSMSRKSTEAPGDFPFGVTDRRSVDLDEYRVAILVNDRTLIDREIVSA